MKIIKGKSRVHRALVRIVPESYKTNRTMTLPGGKASQKYVRTLEIP